MDAIDAKKESLVNEFGTALVKALEGTVDELKAFIQVADSLENKEKAEQSKANFEKSIATYTDLIAKIENKDKFANKDYKLLAIELTERANRMVSESQKMVKAADQLVNMSKVFFA